MSDQSGVEATSSVNQSSDTNRTNADSSTYCDHVDSSGYPFFMVVYSLIFLVGLLLNGYIMKFYFCSAGRQASSSIRVYLKNLSAADFLLCLCLPIRITNYADNSPTSRLINCNFGSVVLFLNMNASILFMGYIAANRYLKIVRGTHILQTVQAARIISSVTWVFLLALSTAYVILSFETQKALTAVLVNCEALHSRKLIMLYKILHTCSTVGFLFVLISLVFFYYSTSHRVLQARQSEPVSSSPKKFAKSRRTMLVLVCVFCFCFVPYHLVRLPSAFLQRDCSWSNVLYLLREVTVIVSVLNICLDPLIYFIFSKALRRKLSQRGVSGNR
ncbi:G-protein coupled receptor 87 [Collichthys lucidus]|uniref:G-protein coupled receptor 87 n=1 Tax=Collichthys lucidus TaxID=240159 RepID=A0A4U5U3D8_COLLU|nr:G-protein coupled receptor 87 [Collichthys lucidus]